MKAVTRRHRTALRPTDIVRIMKTSSDGIPRIYHRDMEIKLCRIRDRSACTAMLPEVHSMDMDGAIARRTPLLGTLLQHVDDGSDLSLGVTLLSRHMKICFDTPKVGTIAECGYMRARLLGDVGSCLTKEESMFSREYSYETGCLLGGDYPVAHDIALYLREGGAMKVFVSTTYRIGHGACIMVTYLLLYQK